MLSPSRSMSHPEQLGRSPRTRRWSPSFVPLRLASVFQGANRPQAHLTRNSASPASPASPPPLGPPPAVPTPAARLGPRRPGRGLPGSSADTSREGTEQGQAANVVVGLAPPGRAQPGTPRGPAGQVRPSTLAWPGRGRPPTPTNVLAEAARVHARAQGGSTEARIVSKKRAR